MLRKSVHPVGFNGHQDLVRYRMPTTVQKINDRAQDMTIRHSLATEVKPWRTGKSTLADNQNNNEVTTFSIQAEDISVPRLDQPLPGIQDYRVQRPIGPESERPVRTPSTGGSLHFFFKGCPVPG